MQYCGMSCGCGVLSCSVAFRSLRVVVTVRFDAIYCNTVRVRYVQVLYSDSALKITVSPGPKYEESGASIQEREEADGTGHQPDAARP